jgi:hypothetical protein
MQNKDFYFHTSSQIGATVVPSSVAVVVHLTISGWIWNNFGVPMALGSRLPLRGLGFTIGLILQLKSAMASLALT